MPDLNADHLRVLNTLHKHLPALAPDRTGAVPLPLGDAFILRPPMLQSDTEGFVGNPNAATLTSLNTAPLGSLFFDATNLKTYFKQDATSTGWRLFWTSPDAALPTQLYVDTALGDNNNDGLTPATAFADRPRAIAEHFPAGIRRSLDADIFVDELHSGVGLLSSPGKVAIPAFTQNDFTLTIRAQESILFADVVQSIEEVPVADTFAEQTVTFNGTPGFDTSPTPLADAAFLRWQDPSKNVESDEQPVITAPSTNVLTIASDGSSALFAGAVGDITTAQIEWPVGDEEVGCLLEGAGKVRVEGYEITTPTGGSNDAEAFFAVTSNLAEVAFVRCITRRWRDFVTGFGREFRLSGVIMHPDGASTMFARQTPIRTSSVRCLGALQVNASIGRLSSTLNGVSFNSTGALSVTASPGTVTINRSDVRGGGRVDLSGAGQKSINRLTIEGSSDDGVRVSGYAKLQLGRYEGTVDNTDHALNLRGPCDVQEFPTATNNAQGTLGDVKVGGRVAVATWATVDAGHQTDFVEGNTAVGAQIGP